MVAIPKPSAALIGTTSNNKPFKQIGLKIKIENLKIKIENIGIFSSFHLEAIKYFKNFS